MPKKGSSNPPIRTGSNLYHW